MEAALARGASVAAVARAHDVNANLVFKWIRRSREGGRDRRCGAGKGALRLSPRADEAPPFVPVRLVASETAALRDAAVAPYLDLVKSYGWADYMFRTNQGIIYPALATQPPITVPAITIDGDADAVNPGTAHHPGKVRRRARAFFFAAPAIICGRVQKNNGRARSSTRTR